MSFSQEIIQKYQLRLTKRYGQNFLKDQNILNKITEVANIGKSDFVLEIGPGAGALTRGLCMDAGFVLAVEIDKNLIEPLQKEFSQTKNLRILHGDAMKIDFQQYIREMVKTPFSNYVIVANLPYYITTPLIFKFLEDEPLFNQMVVMVQKEVAERMVAKPGHKEYGMLSVVVNYYARCQKSFDVSKHCFIPKPEVESAVIRLERHINRPVLPKDETLFFRVVKAAFRHRRKTFVNGLANEFQVTKTQLNSFMEKLGFDKNIRGEMLSIEEFSRISDDIIELI